MRSLFFLAFVMALGGCSRPQERVEERKPAPAPPPVSVDNRRVLVVFGDSISAGFGLPEGQSFPDDLQKKVESWHVVNLGISGDTTEGGAARIESATSLKPAIVILELGGNDGLRGLPLKATRENLEQMITAFQAAGAKVVLAGMSLPPNYGPTYIHDFEKIFKDLAAEHKLTFIPFLYVDIVTKDMRYIQHDGIHPTAEGSQIIAGTVLRAIQPLLQ